MRKLNTVLSFIAFFILFNQFASFSQTPSDVFISEYVEGTSNNKAIEIFNGTGSAIDLTAGNYILQFYFNGSSTVGTTINLTGTVASNGVFVLAQSSASFASQPYVNQTNGSSWYNGDDAIVLRKGGASGQIVDVIGQVGFDPGTEWGTGLTSTADNTLRRKSTICSGDTNPSDVFDPSLEWNGFATDDFSGLGTHTSSCVAGPFITLIPTSLSFTTTVGVQSAEQSYTVKGNSLTEDITVTAPVNFGVSSVPGGPYTSSITISATSANTAPVTIYVVYNPSVAGTQTGKITHVSGTVSVNLAVEGTATSGEITRIYTIQGNGNASPLVGTIVTTEGIVTGDFQGTNQLGGYFIQDTTGDGDTSTSDGIFIYDTTHSVGVGDYVRLTGTVDEYFNKTEIKNVSSVSVLSSGNILMSPVNISLPVAAISDLEKYEGMLAKFSQTLTVTETFNLGRYGELSLSSDGRLFNPTNFIDPNDDPPSGTSSSGNSNVAAITAQQDLNNRRTILLDDGSNVQNPPIVPYLNPADTTLRCGTTIDNLTGNLDFSFGEYVIEPTQVPAFNYAPRPAVPSVGAANVKVSSFNVLNYFNGNGMGGGFPTARGANTLTEFNRQRVKIISAIKNLNADVIGLTEIENDGDGPNSAIADLVNGLNDSTSSGTYAYIPDPTGANGNTGTDAIKVAMIYKPSVVTPAGFAKADTNSIHNRPPLAQTFILNSNGEKFTVIINHFKSKGCTDATGADLDQGDGQGCYNNRRKLQATDLLSFISSMQTSSGDSDVIVVGDFNAYGEEDPIDILRAGGLTDILPGTYSYVFDGQSGSLDHAFTTPSLYSKVTGAAKWHINADEPIVKDYNQEYNPPYVYSPDAYRSSDHDPVLAGLDLEPCISDTSITNVVVCSNQLPYQWNGKNYDSAGTYYFDTTTAGGCDSTAALMLKVNESPVASANAGSVNCNGGTTTVTVSATGGTLPYNGTGSFTVGAGTYNYIVSDSNSCSDTVTITVTQPDPISINVGTGTISCYGGTTSATVVATGGTAPYQYKLNSKKPQSSNVFNNLKAGSYLMTVTDTKTCSKSVSFDVIQPTQLKLVLVQKIKPSCKGGSDGSIEVTAVGGTAPYQYSLNNGTFTSNGTFTNLHAGNYTFTVKDANGCTVSASGSLGDGRGTCTQIIASQNQQPVTSSKLTNGSQLNLNILPNPSTTSFTFIAQSTSNEKIEITVTDAYGRKVFAVKGTANKQYTFGSNFTSGLYFVRVIQGKNIQTLKIVKAKG